MFLHECYFRAEDGVGDDVNASIRFKKEVVDDADWMVISLDRIRD